MYKIMVIDRHGDHRIKLMEQSRTKNMKNKNVITSPHD